MYLANFMYRRGNTPRLKPSETLHYNHGALCSLMKKVLTLLVRLLHSTEWKAYDAVSTFR